MIAPLSAVPVPRRCPPWCHLHLPDPDGAGLVHLSSRSPVVDQVVVTAGVADGVAAWVELDVAGATAELSPAAAVSVATRLLHLAAGAASGLCRSRHG